jgi:glycyl-tRNA synthetase alpha chain
MEAKENYYLSDIISNLEAFWVKEGNCVLLQSGDVEVGAGTLTSYTALECIRREEWRACYVQYSRRPTDGRFGENPNRLSAYYQFQVILKPFPENIRDIYLKSLALFGIKTETHDIRFVEDDWENPSIGAAGLGFEVWINGMECTQWTYMQQIGGIPLEVIPCEITYGIERIAMYIQNKKNIFDIEWNSSGITYGDIFKEREIQFSHYYKTFANADNLIRSFKESSELALVLCENKLFYPAYEEALKASAALNILDARGAVSQIERANYILQIRNLVKQILTSIKQA